MTFSDNLRLNGIRSPDSGQTHLSLCNHDLQDPLQLVEQAPSQPEDNHYGASASRKEGGSQCRAEASEPCCFVVAVMTGESRNTAPSDGSGGNGITDDKSEVGSWGDAL